MFAGIDPLWTCVVLAFAALAIMSAFLVSSEDCRNMKHQYVIGSRPLIMPKPNPVAVWYLNTPASVIEHSCPDDETLAAFIDGTLADPECIRVNDHLNYCPRCYELVSETREVLRSMRASEMPNG